jgi:hypothetical protein
MCISFYKITFSRTGKRWTIRRILKMYPNRSVAMSKRTCGGPLRTDLVKRELRLSHYWHRLLSREMKNQEHKSPSVKLASTCKIRSINSESDGSVCTSSGTVSILHRKLSAPFLSKPIKHSPLTWFERRSMKVCRNVSKFGLKLHPKQYLMTQSSTTLSLEISLTLKPLALGFEKKYTIFSSINLFRVIPYFKYTGNSCRTSFNMTAMQQLTKQSAKL